MNRWKETSFNLKLYVDYLESQSMKMNLVNEILLTVFGTCWHGMFLMILKPS